MHKKIKLFVSMLAAAALLVLLPGSNALTANAAEGNTYSIQFFGGAINDWCYVTGSTFDEKQLYSTIGGLKSRDLKDGDHIVVYDSGYEPTKHLDLSGFNLGSLTIHKNATAVFIADSIKDCYVLAGAYAAINGDVTNATLYDNTTCTFNNNVLDMVLYIADKPNSNISCGGTVGHFRILYNTGGSRNEFYDIPQNTMKLVDGTIQYAVWSPTPSDAYLQARAEADGTATTDGTAAAETAPNTSSGSSTPAAGTSSDEYDRVPKTGESNNVIWLVSLVGAAAVLFAGSYGLYKKAK